MHRRLLLVLVLSTVSLSGCNVGEREIIVETCGQPIDVSKCKWKGQLFSCLVENRDSEIYPGTPVWRYDADGKALDYLPYQYVVGLKPGEKRREKLPVTKYNNDTTAKIIFCPKSPDSIQ